MLGGGRKGAYSNYGEDGLESSELVFVNLGKSAEKRGGPQILLFGQLQAIILNYIVTLCIRGLMLNSVIVLSSKILT